jgi:hypothetical protein
VRQKLGMAAFVLLLVAVWGVGFLWVRGDLDRSPAKAAAGTARPSASATPSASPSAPAEPSAAAYTGTVNRLDERRPVDINPVPARPRPVALPPVLKFTVASFNVLGSSHTRGRGGKASGLQRLPGAISLLNSHGISVVGFQEFQGDQRHSFARRAPGWAIYPGDALGNLAGENSIGWRTDTWEMVKPGSVPIPYFNGGVRQMPSVLLRHKQTGIQAYFSNFHNPAETRQFHNQGRFRAAATTREIALFNQLERTGIPQFVTGDMNERASWFCRVTGSTPLIAAAGGRNNGGCAPPRPTQIDWILGSRNVQFSGYTIDRSPLVRRTTDHPIIVAQVTVDALKFENAYRPEATTPGQ